MKSPGITVRPIITLDGAHEFSEVVLDEVAVPESERIGAEHEGWLQAKHLMRFARTNNTTSALLHRTWRAVERSLACKSVAKEEMKFRLARLQTSLTAFESMELQYLAAGKLSGEDETSASIMKLAATELHQKMTELLLDVEGPHLTGGPNPACDSDHHASEPGFSARKYLATRAASIYSGTSEIHRNIISRQLLSGQGPWRI